MHRGPVTEIDLAAVKQNFRLARKISGNSKVIAVVKADAYGHGAREVSRVLEQEQVSYLAVAYTEEAVDLRHAGIKSPILVLFDRHDIPDYLRYNLTPVICDVKTARLFSVEAKKAGKPIEVHLKVDTGMGRFGFSAKDIAGKINEIKKMDCIRVTGLMSHFSDADLADRSFAFKQFEIFNQVRDVFKRAGIRPLCHIANSAAVLSFPEAHLDGIRPGLMLYGYSPVQDARHKNTKPAFKNYASFLRPAMTVKTNILYLRKFNKGMSVSYARTFVTTRESLIAVLPVGYADGYSRMFSNNAGVLIKGKHAPVVGRICMDTAMVDVTDIAGVSEGDEVVLLGKQNKSEITAHELAKRAGTIPYEILTSISSTAQRVFINGS